MNKKSMDDNRRGSIDDAVETDKNGVDRDISENYDSILRESAVLTTISGFLFGFLLNISINSPSYFSSEDSIVLMLALFTVTFATCFFFMPVFYHHIQFPYKNVEKFKLRSHRFIVFGIVPLLITLYFGLLLGLRFGLRLGEASAIEYLDYVSSAIPFVSVYLFYKNRK